MKSSFLPGKLRSAFSILALAVIYGIIAHISLHLAFQHASGSPVWPPSGIAFAAILFSGYRLWPGIMIGAFAAVLPETMTGGTSFLLAAAVSLVIATGNTLEAILGVLLTRRFIRLRNPLHQTSDIFRLCGIIILMCLVSASIGPIALAISGTLSWAVFPTAFWTWWLGDMTGIFMLAPFFLLWYRNRRYLRERASLQWRSVVDAAGYIILLLIVALGVFSGHLRPSSLNHPGSYMLIPIIVLAAFRFGEQGVGWSIPVISGIALWGTLRGFGPFVRVDLNQSLAFLQIFIAVITLTGMVLAAALREKEKAQMVLRRNQRDLSDFFENATVGLHRIGSDGIIQWANRAELEMLGYSAEEYIGHPIAQFHVDQKKIVDMLMRLSRGETLHNYDAQLRCKDGSVRDVVVDTNVLLEKDKIVYIRGFTRDITDRKQMERVLFAHEKWFRTLIENSSDIITLVSADGTIVYSSPSTTRVMGYPLDQYIGRNIFEFVHLDDLDFVMQRFQEVIERPGNLVSAECRFRCKDGSWVWLEGSGNNMLADQSIKAVVINGRDISARKKAQEALRESEERLHAIFESSKDAIAYVDFDGVLLDMNEGFVRLTGYSKQELFGQKGQNLIPPEYRDMQNDKFQTILRTGEPYEYENQYIRKDGSRVPILLTVFMVRDGEGKPAGLAAIIKDITERKKAEEQRVFLAAIVDSSSDAIIGKTLDGIVTSWNHGAQELYGYTAEEMIGRSISTLIPSDRPHELETIMERLRRGERIKQLETVRVCKSGASIDVSLTISPIMDATGKVMAASTVARDITERKRVEQQLQETARLKSEFTSTVSHELRTPLAISKEALSLLLRGKIGEIIPKQKEILTIASTNIDRLCFLIDDILDFSKIEAGKMEMHREPWDIIPVVQESCNGWKLRTDFKKISLNLKAPAGPFILPIDKLRFLQIFSNLLNNAAKFTPEGGRIDVEVAEEKDAVRFAVSDSGPGIAPEEMGRLFQKFQQFKRTNGPGARGTGLGLSIVKSLVELHGGEITVNSTVGKGSSFIFRLPKGAPLGKEVSYVSQKNSDR